MLPGMAMRATEQLLRPLTTSPGLGSLLLLPSTSKRHGHFQKLNRNPRIKLILLEDVPNLGFQGEEVSVKRGYARGNLVQNKLAVYATEENRLLHQRRVDVDVSEENKEEERRRVFVQHLRHQVKYCGLHYRRPQAKGTRNQFSSPPDAQKLYMDLVERKKFDWLLPHHVKVDVTDNTFGPHKATVDISYFRDIIGDIKVEASRLLPGQVKSEEQLEWEQTPWSVKMVYTVSPEGVCPLKKRKPNKRIINKEVK
eukprot:gb/GEZN01015954.1/.p1 GENE.gb/GEZN01015954.1/~~gb/GEZN01015954.1/.p1  ORF type:complete len:254 (+),score=33.14 gb/GEZN01015954.1/:72-833(+)